MRGKSKDAVWIQRRRGSQAFGGVSRVVFSGHSFSWPGDALGVINYGSQVAVVRRAADGALFVDLDEALLPGRGRPLTRRIIYN